MRRTTMLGLASVAAFAGVVFVHPIGVTRAEDPTDPKVKTDKTDTGSVQSSIVRTYAAERLLEVKIEHFLEAAPMQPGDKKPEPAVPANASGLRTGQVIFVEASACTRVFDEKGDEKTRDDKTAWFTKDEGWAMLKAGQRLRIDYCGSHETAPPKDFPEGARTEGKLLVYTAKLIELLPESGVGCAVKPEIGTVEGAVVRLFAAEKLIELKVEACPLEKTPPKDTDAKDKDAPKCTAPAVGTLILIRLEHATVEDDKGVERKRDDKTAWFSKDDGWSILKAGVRVKVEYTSTQQVHAPADFPKDARAGGTVMVYNASTVRLLPDTK